MSLDLSPSLAPFARELHNAISLYKRSDLSQDKELLLKAFVDIIHDDHSLERFFQVSVTVPPLTGPFQAEFHLFASREHRFLRVCTSREGLLDPPRPDTSGLDPAMRTVQEHEGRLLFPLYPRSGNSRQEITSSAAGGTLYAPDPYFASHSLLGIFLVFPVDTLSDEDREFFAILTRWMGNKLNNRLIAERHLEHLRFLNDLGRDIGHNIIVPNMYLKHLLRQGEKELAGLAQSEQEFAAVVEEDDPDTPCQRFLSACRTRRKALEQTWQELHRHHNQITLYLESLFRQQHFEQGHLVLQPTRCFIERDIILPQLEMYRAKLERQGITVDKPTNLDKQDFPLMVDVGLLSQVYANLFSNAVKYTGEIIDHRGIPRKAMAYGAEEVPDFPVPGQKGIKFNVFTTGRPLDKEELKALFDEGYRAEDSQGIPGSGHGLNFIRRVIEVHGGRVGCEPVEEGNNFFFILPLSSLATASEAGKNSSVNTSSPSNR